jgi:hypothetical protein
VVLHADRASIDSSLLLRVARAVPDSWLIDGVYQDPRSRSLIPDLRQNRTETLMMDRESITLHWSNGVSDQYTKG